MQSHSDSPSCYSPAYEDNIIKEILLTHSPDNRAIDPTPFLRAAESIIHCITNPSVLKSKESTIHGVCIQDDEFISKDAELGRVIHCTAAQILWISSTDRSVHSVTTAILELLGNYSWGTKVVVVLAALATSYGELWLIMQLHLTNQLALSVTILKNLTKSEITNVVRCRFKALRSLFDKMIDMSKCILEFEKLPEQFISLDYEALSAVKACIHISSYWIIRKAVSCTSQINSMLENKKVPMSSLTAKWEIWSSVLSLSNMHYLMQKALSAFNLQIESKLQMSLAHLFGEVYEDNQRVLSTLFAMKDNLPLRHAFSEKKVAVGALANRGVLLLLSSPMIDLDQFLLLVQQLEFNPSDELEKPYEVLWVPIGSAMQWSDDEKKGFSELLRIVPWYSVDPSVLCSSVIDFFRKDWQFHDAPLVVVLNPKGSVASLNALDMVLVWGAKAYPFTVSQERELWDGQVSPMQILMDEIDPLMSHWVAVGRIICLYGSNNIQWIRELSRKMNGIMQSGLSLVLIYVGSKNFENLRDILTSIIRENLSNYLSTTKIKFFWIRLESIRNLKIRIESQSGCDSLLGEVNSLLNASCDNEDWLLTGEGLLTNFMRGKEVLDCLERFDQWGDDVSTYGFIGAIRKTLNPPEYSGPCNTCSMVPYVEGAGDSIVFCRNCNSPMKKRILYQCIRS